MLRPGSSAAERRVLARLNMYLTGSDNSKDAVRSRPLLPCAHSTGVRLTGLCYRGLRLLLPFYKGHEMARVSLAVYVTYLQCLFYGKPQRPKAREPDVWSDRLTKPYEIFVCVAVMRARTSAPGCGSCRAASPGIWRRKTWSWTTSAGGCSTI